MANFSADSCVKILGVKVHATSMDRTLSRLESAITKMPEVSIPRGRYPNPPFWVGSDGISKQSFRLGELFLYLEIADTHKLSRIADALCPNIPIDVLGQSSDESQRFVILPDHSAEVAIFE